MFSCCPLGGAAGLRMDLLLTHEHIVALIVQIKFKDNIMVSSHPYSDLEITV